MKKRTLRAAAMMMTAAMCAGCWPAAAAERLRLRHPRRLRRREARPPRRQRGILLRQIRAQQAAEGRIQVSFWEGLKGSHLENIEKIVNDYNNSQDKVWVTVSYQGDYNETAAQAQTALAAGNQPNLCQLEVWP